VKQSLIKALTVALLVIVPIGRWASQTALAQESGFDFSSDQVLFTINDRPITADEYERLKRGSAIFQNSLGGATGEDLKNLLMDQAILINMARADAADETIPEDDVNKFISDLRAQQGLDTEADFEERIKGFGYTPEAFRDAVREQLQLNKRIEVVRNNARLEPEELAFYLELHRDQMPAKSQYQLSKEALTAKQDQSIETWVEGLLFGAFVEFPENSNLELYDPVVARVGEHEIRLSTLNRAVYFNPSIGKYIGSSKDQSTALIQQFFKPQALENMINQEVGVQYAIRSSQPFVGGKADLFEQAKIYATRDLQISESEAKAYYLNHIGAYNLPATAEIIEVKFARRQDAKAFYTKLLRSGGDPFKLAPRYRGTASEARRVSKENLPAKLVKLAFDKPLKPAQRGQVTILIDDKTRATVLIARKIRAGHKSTFAEVKNGVMVKALAEKRAQAGQQWLVAERKKTRVTSFLNEVNATLEERSKRKPVNVPRPETPITPTPTSPADPAPTEPAPGEPAPRKPVSPPL
jgi:PPIC-type PPIASE domain/SurA N-terminal domain